jgi:hypothetical protein
MGVVLSDEEIQLAELVAENFAEYEWIKPALAGWRSRQRRSLLFKMIGHKRDNDGVQKSHRKVLVYGAAALLLVLQGYIYTAVEFGADVLGARPAVAAHQSLGRPIGQFEQIGPTAGHIIRARATGCLNLTVDEMSRWESAGFSEPDELCG